MSLEADVKRAAALARLDNLITRVRGGHRVEFDDVKLLFDGLIELRSKGSYPTTVNDFARACVMLINPDRVREVATWLRRELLR